MISTLFSITFHLLSFVKRIQDNIIPERRQRRKRQRLRNDFYDGSLLMKTRGGSGVVSLRSLSLSSNASSYEDMASENNSKPLARADTISTALFCIAAATWLVGLL